MNPYFYTSEPFLANKKHGIQFLYFLLTFSLCFLFSSLIVGLFTFLLWDNAADSTLATYIHFIYFSQTFASIGVFLAPSLLFSYLSTRSFFRLSGATCSPSPNSIALVPMLVLFAFPLILALAEWNASFSLPDSFAHLEQWMREMSQKSNEMLLLLTSETNISTLLLNLFFLAVVPAVCEEFLFRGALQPFLHNWIKRPHLAILITSFVFSFIHFEFFGFIPRFLLSLFLGYLLLWSKSLWLPIIAHFCHNALSLIVHFLCLRKGVNTDNFSLEHFSTFAPLLFISLIGFFVGLWWIRIKMVKKEGENCSNQSPPLD